MARTPDIGNVQLYPDRPLRKSDKNGYVLKFYCPIAGKRIRKNCGTRDRRDAQKILKECGKRLVDGSYVASDGAISAAHEIRVRKPLYMREQIASAGDVTWIESFDKFCAFKKKRLRPKSLESMESRLQMTERIFEARRADDGLEPGVTLREVNNLGSFEYLQEQLLDGVEGLYDSRAASTVNSIVGDVMTFIRYCQKHEWVDKIPKVDDLDQEEAMRGRPITGEEFDRLLGAVPKVVGPGAAPSWNFLLKVLWESGFRIGDVMNFYWDDETKIHPVWTSRHRENWTLRIPSTQKNGKVDEIPMLPVLGDLLAQVPAKDRQGMVIKLHQVEYEIPGKKDGAFAPCPEDLAELIADYSNLAIGKACVVSSHTVQSWLSRLGLQRTNAVRLYGQDVPAELIAKMRVQAKAQPAQSKVLAGDRVSRIVSAIGQEARVIVRQPDESRGIRIKYASAHDLRRSLAERLYNKGITAETLMVIMRHRDFTTTRKFYGAKRRAESAAREVHALLGGEGGKSELVGGLVGGTKKAPELSAEELLKLKALLQAF